MLPLLSFSTIAQIVPPPIVAPAPTPSPSPSPLPVAPPQENLSPQESLPPPDSFQPIEVFQPQEVRPLPGKLDEVPVFNSNSPEIVQTEGVLLSTFPPKGMRVPAAHLNFAFQGRFDFFSHHIAKADTPSQTRTLFQGVLVYNPTATPITLEILQGASYLTRPDASFVTLPSFVDDPLGTVYAGPGSRAMNDVLRGRRQGNWPSSLVIPPGQAQMLMNLPIPVGTVIPSSNGRSTLLRLRSSGPLYMANLAMFAPPNGNGAERIPTLAEWQNLLIGSGVSGPRDIPPTPIQQQSNYSKIIYGRVAGVALGSEWRATLTDTAKSDHLSVPERGRAFSYGLSTLYRGTFGTGQVQSAKMLVRYPDTAYQANGNYGIQYSLSLPLLNTTKQQQKIVLSLQTPIKDDKVKGGLLFLKPIDDRVFFRGPVRVRYSDDRGTTQTRHVHITMQRGQEGEPIVTLNLNPGERRLVQLDLLYPPDSTPPQVLTIRNVSN